MRDPIDRRAALNVLCDNCDHPQASCPFFPCAQYNASEGLPSACTKVHSAYEVDKDLIYELERGTGKDAAAIIYEWQIKRELQSKLIQQADEVGAIDYIREDGPINTRTVRFTASLNIAKEDYHE